MTDWLVHMEVRLPADMPPERQAGLAAAEAERAAELATAGHLVRLWREPGRRANWGLWRAEDATALHAALASLPLWPWLDVEVTALAAHPNDPGPA
jgi:muconolactone D-isomerase